MGTYRNHEQRREKGTLAGARYFQRVQQTGCPEKDTQEDTADRRLKVFPRRKRSGWPRASQTSLGCSAPRPHPGRQAAAGGAAGPTRCRLAMLALALANLA